MEVKKFISWANHPLWSFCVTMLFAPLFVDMDMVNFLWLVGVAFGVVHEGLQLLGIPHKETWKEAVKDVGDFAVGGLVAWVVVRAILVLS